MYAEGVDLEQEDNAARFLGLHIKSNSKIGFLNLMQKGLINKCGRLLALMLEPQMESLPLSKESLLLNICRRACLWRFQLQQSCWNDLYLACHTCPDINYAVKSAARYIFCPKLLHKYALKHIVCYLKAASDKGLIMTPSEQLFFVGIDYFCKKLKLSDMSHNKQLFVDMS